MPSDPCGGKGGARLGAGGPAGTPSSRSRCIVLAFASVLATCASPHRAPRAGAPPDALLDTRSDTAPADTTAPVDATTGLDDATECDNPTECDAAGAGIGHPDADAAIDSDAAPDCAELAAAATACFSGHAPGPGDMVEPFCPPTTSCPAFDQPAFEGELAGLGPAELELQLGAIDAAGPFVAYTRGQFVPLTRGPQGGFHVWLAFRVRIPGATGARRSVQFRAFGLEGCKEIAAAGPGYYSATRVAGDPGWYAFASSTAPGLQLRFTGQKPADSPKFCGIRLDVRLQVMDLESRRWGRGRITLRTWDSVPAKG